MAFRLQVNRAALRVDVAPTENGIQQFAESLMAEGEAAFHGGSMAPIKDTVKVKALGGDNGGTKDEGKPRDGRDKIKENGEGKGTKDAKEAKNDKSEGKNGKGDQKGAASDKPVCRYFLSDNGCKKGQKCPFPHEWNWNIQAGPVLVLWFDPTYEARMSSEGCPKGEEGDWRGCEVQGWKRQRKRWRSWNSAW